MHITHYCDYTGVWFPQTPDLLILAHHAGCDVLQQRLTVILSRQRSNLVSEHVVTFHHDPLTCVLGAGCTRRYLRVS